jgi:hypothetical protein
MTQAEESCHISHQHLLRPVQSCVGRNTVNSCFVYTLASQNLHGAWGLNLAKVVESAVALLIATCLQVHY